MRTTSTRRGRPYSAAGGGVPLYVEFLIVLVASFAGFIGGSVVTYKVVVRTELERLSVVQSDQQSLADRLTRSVETQRRRLQDLAEGTS